MRRTNRETSHRIFSSLLLFPKPLWSKCFLELPFLKQPQTVFFVLLKTKFYTDVANEIISNTNPVWLYNNKFRATVGKCFVNKDEIINFFKIPLFFSLLWMTFSLNPDNCLHFWLVYSTVYKWTTLTVPLFFTAILSLFCIEMTT
jgi:hypothetical protein